VKTENVERVRMCNQSNNCIPDHSASPRSIGNISHPLASFFFFKIVDVLAAGVALGHAGEWEALCDYLKSSYNASRLGQVRCLYGCSGFEIMDTHRHTHSQIANSTNLRSLLYILIVSSLWLRQPCMRVYFVTVTKKP
jgi:hypothetical protein